MHSFSANTRIRSQEINENFDEVTNGSGDTDDNSLALMREDLMFDFVQSGLIWSTVSGLDGTMTAGIMYMEVSGKKNRITVTSISSKAFTASKDTYVDVGNDGTMYYTEVANNTTSPALAANRMRIAIVATDGSAITGVQQNEQERATGTAASRGKCGLDNEGNPIRNIEPFEMSFRVIRHNGTTARSNLSSGYLPNMLQEVMTPYASIMDVKARWMCRNNGGTSTTRVYIYIDGSSVHPAHYEVMNSSWASRDVQATEPIYMNANQQYEVAMWCTSTGFPAEFTNSYDDSSDIDQYNPALYVTVRRSR